MANFFEGLLNIAKHPIDEAKWMWDETKNVGKPLLKGDFGESFDQFKGTFGRHNEMMSENIAKPLGGDNWITQNPDAVAGAIVGGILAAPAIGGAMGGGAGGAGGGVGGTTAGSQGALSGVGTGWQGGAQLGFGGTSYAPTTAFGQGAVGSTSSAGSGMGAMGMPTAYTPTTAFGQTASQAGTSAGASGQGFDFTKFSQMAKNLQSGEKEQAPMPAVSARRGWSGFDSKLYSNPALEKEYMRIYTEPTFKINK